MYLLLIALFVFFAVCIYEPTNDGDWNNTLCLSGPYYNSSFGNAIDIYGPYLVVGAPNIRGTHGAVYVYKQLGYGNWTLYQVLESVTGFNSQFGYSVSIHNTTIAVGAVGFRSQTFGALGRGKTSCIKMY